MRRAALLAAALAATMPVAATAKAPAKPTLEQRVQRLEDEDAIRHIFIAYAAALDGKNADAYVALFAKNGQWINGSIVRKGPAEIHALIDGMFHNTPAGYVNKDSFELTFHPDIKVDGDRATSRSEHVLFRRHMDGSGLPQAVLFGRYEDEFIRENGVWKILKRVDIPTIPTPEEWGRIMRARQQQPAQPPAGGAQ
ncbi:nuclear transport factor 2 family protein [Sphingobium nicotianae]|uniref:Nuclear transport factor 2 family protein n=1 Tax=Sphingobium nicotianae TaxID=2782607 RepID=A0A9X1DCC7_9SPHN|nr:nuclear transport factor 2 family protein [Sphingobium nicotianae]MBT2187372.1 nuclear transport factor 2 family protein [Sphingobium nicotianae]